jgi:rod shape-determining protein MreC
LPFRGIFQKILLVFILSFAAAIVVISKSQHERMAEVRAVVVDATLPLLKVVSMPVDAVVWARDTIHDAIFVFQENKMLRQQNARLARIQMIASQLQAENVRLRESLHFVPESNYRFITARVISDLSSPYMASTMINAGSKDGIKKGQVVVSDKGLVGRILEVGSRSSRILLLSDVNSRVPVITSNSHERGILMGGKREDMPIIRHLKMDTEVQPGESVVTSGDGQFYPAGLPVGVVKDMKEDEGARLVLFVQPTQLEFVNVVDYQPEGEGAPPKP